MISAAHWIVAHYFPVLSPPEQPSIERLCPVEPIMACLLQQRTAALAPDSTRAGGYGRRHLGHTNGLIPATTRGRASLQPIGVIAMPARIAYTPGSRISDIGLAGFQGSDVSPPVSAWPL